MTQSSTTPDPGAQRGRISLDVLLRKNAISIVAVLLIVLVTLGNPAFLSFFNIANMLSQWAPAGLMAIGMTYVIIVGGFDLSIAATFSFTAVMAAMVGQTMPPSIAFAAAVAVGAAVGAVNGALVAKLKVNPFIATVGTGFIVTGLTFVLTGNVAFMVSDPGFAWLGAGRIAMVPYSGILLIFALIVGGVVLARTYYGHVVYAVGGNAEASHLTGLRVPLIEGSTYLLLGALTGIAGFISASQLSSAQANMDPNIMFDVLTVVIVGGTPLGGGIGSVGRTAIGLVIIATISNGFVLLGISPYYQNIIKGVLIVGALVLESVVNRKSGAS